MRRLPTWRLLLLSAPASSQAYAELDHEWSLEQSGIWARQYKAGPQDYRSFPGEATPQAGFVTPFIANYGRQDPCIWALEALPVDDAIARRIAGRFFQAILVR